MPEPIAPARLSASILLVRDDPDLQVFMARRHHKIDFAGGALVFPGGKASKDDARAGWAERIDGTAGALTVFAVAAVRETFEECGLLLCRPESARGAGNPLAGADVAAALAPHRAAVDRGEASFLDLVTDAGLVLALDRLAHFAHLITPEFMPRRFDTQFFVARAPAGQIAAHDGRETTASEWLTPADALGRSAAGTAMILFPTRMNLEVLARASNAEEALAQAAKRPVVSVMPAIETDDAGREWLTIPVDAGYDTCRALLANERARAAR